MKIRLLKPYRNYKAGREWNCPLASIARTLIEEGVAEAIELCDLHLNTGGTNAKSPDGTVVEPAGQPAGKPPKKPRRGKKAPNEGTESNNLPVTDAAADTSPPAEAAGEPTPPAEPVSEPPVAKPTKTKKPRSKK